MNNHITQISGDSSGKTLTIMGSIHGNERTGAAVLELLAKELADKKLCGEIYLILGNPAAYERNTRFIDEDLNRLFGENYQDLHTIDPEKLNIEQKRALEIAPYLAKSDYLLDLHSTIKPSVPFVYCEADGAHLKLADFLDTEYIISASPDFRPADLVTSADNFVDSNGGVGITYEAGWHEDPQKEEEVLEKTKLFIQHLGIYNFQLTANPKHHYKNDPKHLYIYNHLIPESPHFHFVRDFTNFDFIQQGEPLAIDNGKQVLAERDSYIIFPKKELKPGKVACYLAHQS